MNKDLQKRIAALSQTDDKTDPYILNARIIHSRSHMTWSPEEDTLLKELLQNKVSIKCISQSFKRSYSSIEARIKSLSLNTVMINDITSKIPNTAKPKTTNEDHVYNLIKYWRNSLADAKKIGLSFSKMKTGEKLSLVDIKSGQLPQDQIQRFFDDTEKEYRKKSGLTQQNGNGEQKIKKISVIIAPLTVFKKSEHGTKIYRDRTPSEIFPLWLIADLMRDGRLMPSDDIVYPWLERKCLTPNEHNESAGGYPIIGDVSQVDTFYNQNSYLLESGNLTWEIFFSFAENLFNFVINSEIVVFSNQDYSLEEFGYILPINEIFEVSKNITTTYDQYVSAHNKIPKLLRKLCTSQEREPLHDKTKEELFFASRKHLGQMQGNYPLSASQRKSLHYFNDPEDNDIFTIHGPPGTGKTSLLLSVIASLWVEAAIKRKAPPILVAASTNNLAVTNILDNFNQIGASNEDNLSKRWLPDFKSYGLYLASSAKIKEAENDYICLANKKGAGSIEAFYSPEYCEKAEKYFISQYNLHYGKNESELTACQEFIHHLMIEKESLLNNIIDFSYEINKLQEEMENKYGSLEALSEQISKTVDDKISSQQCIDMLINLEKNWYKYKTENLKWYRIFSWFPGVKSILIDNIKRFTMEKHLLFPEPFIQIKSIDDFIVNEINQKKTVLKTFENTLNELQAIQNKFESLMRDKLALEKLVGFNILPENIFDFASNENPLCKIDTTLRYTLFCLATHYWEISWLQENQNINKLSYSKKDRKRYWKIHSMLTPCIVTTLHSGPSFFQYKAASQEFETLSHFIDLLIIDEAGQVMPAIAGALISTAKRVLLVGDAKQIEPIFSLPENIDLANAKKFSLCKDAEHYDQLKNHGFLCSGESRTGHSYGNLIIMGQRKAKYHLSEHEVPGMLLIEHRRCAKDIINYCNELCYNNKLLPMTIEEPFNYPRMGYAHIKGIEEKNGSSRINMQEAEVIATWIKKNKNKILSSCKSENLADCIGIVTPFAAQSLVIRDALSAHNLHLNKVGTVHTLQGAEKDIIIFSPVYSANQTTANFFFDISVNMLNVAVSRAKKSFLVFGDIDIFDASRGTLQPSSLLAKYLFSDEKNEIVDIIQPQFLPLVNQENISQINSLKDHRLALKNSFIDTIEELNIVSPFLTLDAIEADEIINLIEQTVTKININIFTDPTLNQKNYHNFKKAIALLETAGANVLLVNNVHSKIITIDNKTFIAGSFNWLSASRNNIHYIRDESSVLYSGKKVSQFIEDALAPIRKKAKAVSHFNLEYS